MELTGEQRDLRDAVRGLLARHRGQAADPPDGPDHDRALWQRACEAPLGSPHHWPTSPSADGAPPPSWVLTGEGHYVLDGDLAGLLLAAARTPDGVALFEVDPRHTGVTRRAVTTLDTTRRL